MHRFFRAHNEDFSAAHQKIKKSNSIPIFQKSLCENSRDFVSRSLCLKPNLGLSRPKRQLKYHFVTLDLIQTMEEVKLSKISHLCTKSSVFQPTRMNTGGQQEVYRHMKRHYDRLKTVAPATDTSPPRSMVSSTLCKINSKFILGYKCWVHDESSTPVALQRHIKSMSPKLYYFSPR